MKNVIWPTLVIAVSSIAMGCASSGPPVSPAQLAETESVIRSAESAGALELAPDLLQKARQAYNAAQQASGRGDHEAVRSYLLETTTYAEAARAQAQTEGLKKDASTLHQQSDDLEALVKQLQGQLRNP
ncbi:MAG: hypothetical protein EWM73_00996 [Nitrospira sp.]|nr:MAG: hypothetical protein EWM73_00996 [Nitrospira sp.]